jgi:hypothetical protein
MAGPPEGYKTVMPLVKGRADFDPEQFYGILDGFGLECTWEQATDCPCLQNDQTDQPDINCAVCAGRGVEYYNPRIINALFGRPGTMDPDELAQQGQDWEGEVQVTVRPEFTLHYQDRLTINDAVIWFSEVRERVDATTQNLRYTIANRVLEYQRDDDVGVQLAITENVDRLTYFKSDNHEELVSLVRDQDFTVTEDGAIDWSLGDVTGRAPSTGRLFSVKYLINPIWVVLGLRPYPTQNLYSTTKLPAKTLLHLPMSVSAQLDFRFSRDGAA